MKRQIVAATSISAVTAILVFSLGRQPKKDPHLGAATTPTGVYVLASAGYRDGGWPGPYAAGFDSSTPVPRALFSKDFVDYGGD